MQDKIGEKKHFKQTIAPTIGRIVHFYGRDSAGNLIGPSAALITDIIGIATGADDPRAGSYLLNIAAFSSEGRAVGFRDIPLVQPGEEPTTHQWVEWPSHQ